VSAASPGKNRRWFLGGVLLLVLLLSVGVFAVHGARWRARVVLLKLEGELPELTWGELLGMLRPGSRYYLEGMAGTRSGYASIRNPWASEEDVQAGLALFAERCGTCHGAEGRGGTGPDLTARILAHGNSDWAMYRVIQRGVPGTGMPSHDLPERETWQLVAAINERRRAIDLAPDSSPTDMALEPVPSARLQAAAADSGNWLLYNGSFNAWRHSRLRQVDTSNVARLRPVWVYQSRSVLDRVETTPLVVGDVMFLTEPYSVVVALDAGTGTLRWRFEPDLGPELNLCCEAVNRGVAILDSTLFLATLDARLFALDARTGRVRWQVRTADYRRGYSFTSAPLAIGPLVVVGVAGGEFGIRGFIDAYDAETGRRAWRFNTVPEPGAPGSETWEPGSLATAGGPAWLTGSYDPDLGLVYYGIGNPGPVYDGTARAGDNLWTNSVVALRATTGELVWHFQFTPHDTHDFDAVQTEVLVDAPWQGRQRKLLLTANKNAFYYVLDRETGEFLTAQPFATQNWAMGLDGTGRPIPRPEAAPSRTGAMVWPSTIGATNWWSPSYSPRTGLFYIPVREQGAVYILGEDEFVEGSMFLGSRGQVRTSDAVSLLRAVDALTGTLRWEHRYPGPTPGYSVAGTLSTAGGLVFSGAGSKFMAFHDRSGTPLWTYNVGGRIMAAPITWLFQGRQRVTLAAGRAVFTFGID
jgi:alcohol dehydrogenase (cytochrome c)